MTTFDDLRNEARNLAPGSRIPFFKSKVSPRFVNGSHDAISGYRGYLFFRNNTYGNCNNGNCATGNCACGDINCVNCFTTPINCANCDGATYLQPNCNCACGYNCDQGQYSTNCSACACGG